MATTQRSLALTLSAILLTCAISIAPAQAFDVVSIKPSQPNGPMMMGSTPAGVQSKGQPLWSTIMMAYSHRSVRYWRSDSIANAPSWVGDTNYDIIAKLDGPTYEQWKDLTIDQRREKMMPLLQKVLSDRCKLVVHIVPRQVPGYQLVLKRGARLTESKSSAAPPGVRVAPLADGGWRLIEPSPDRKIHAFKLRNVTMPQVAETLMEAGELPFEDATGLKGRYDLDLTFNESHKDSDPGPPTAFDVGAAGLVLKPAKVTTTTIVIDHVEKPSMN